jgi:hypothetical protein
MPDCEPPAWLTTSATALTSQSIREMPIFRQSQKALTTLFGGDFDSGEPATDALPDLAGTPTGVLALDVQDMVLDLEGKLMGISDGAPVAVGQPLHPAFPVEIETL